MGRRRTDGDETWNRLINWTKGQKASERLAGHILRAEGFLALDPSHPLGGKDGLKDIVASKDQITWICACYFPRGSKAFDEIKNKFSSDLKGMAKNIARGFVFVTNQELTLGERKNLKNLGKPHTIELYHLERIASILDSPANYGIRLEFLDIELTREEQLAFITNRDDKFLAMSEQIRELLLDYGTFKRTLQVNDEETQEFRSEKQLREMEDELTDKIWYDRHQSLKAALEEGRTKVDSEIWKGALLAAKKVEKKYGKNNLGPYGDFEWGMLNGKLSAIRWGMGDEWDMLDT